MIRGDTFVLKENIKALGGKWNKSEVALDVPGIAEGLHLERALKTYRS